ncbi:hypothetical protein LRS73_28575 [Methylobacterium currus]|uniref:hypothetical protein n=1 Tax=Methylobacterium currus TaxID=2051553 RepID=UPI001E2E99C8|nr:hypothetical protein [Methylobacterium currus]UHC16357.1 hypothetical protein LRS73_28575 [Methylobacterium currus]
MPARLLAALLVTAAVLPAAAGERGARPPRLCPQDAPPGVRLPDRPECREAPPAAVRATAPGFIDLGNGTSLRVSGRAAYEVGYTGR